MLCRYLLLYLLLPAVSVLVAVLFSDILSNGLLSGADNSGLQEQVKTLSEDFENLSRKINVLTSKGAETAGVMGKLNGKVDRLTTSEADLASKLEQHGRDLSSFGQRLDGMQQMIGFSVRMKAEDMRDLAPTQVVSFDDVISNAGGGYDSSTGVFTAPASGTYVFYLQTLNHNTRDGRIFLDIIKNGEFLSRVHAGWSPFENGSTLSVTHLEKGDTVNVQVSFGTAFWGGVFTTFSGFRVSSE